MKQKSTPRQWAMFHTIRAEKHQSWADVRLSPEAERQLREIHDWMVRRSAGQRASDLRDPADQGSPQGYPVLFAGAAGSGKTLTATLLGKELNKTVLRIDLAQVVSKFIGETEKNLSRSFESAATQDAILFFDEADALFGKPADNGGAADKYANQEVSYLLEHIESYPGLVILATSRRASIDDAIIRRLRAVVHFPAPRV